MLTPEQYLKMFHQEGAGDIQRWNSFKEALRFALEIRKFEIELYWKRGTYFWAFIAVAFAAYGVTTRAEGPAESWLASVFASLGLVFSYAWFLVNRGSKFWQENWERHVDVLETEVLGPLYRTVSVSQECIDGNPLTSPGQYSVSKINQILSAFVGAVWVVLFLREMFPLPVQQIPNFPKIAIFLATFGALGTLHELGRSSLRYKTAGLHLRDVKPS
jgi:hypothetical protein